MDAHIDCYKQVRVFLSEEELRQLEKKGTLFDRMHHGTSHLCECDMPAYVALMISYCKEDIFHPDDLPLDKELMKSGGYQLFIGKKGLDLIKDRKCAGTGPLYTGNYIRSSYVSLDGVL